MRGERGLLWVLAISAVFWTRLALGNGRFPAANQLVVDASDEQHIVARTTFGLVQSLDGGAHWSWICESAIQANGFVDPPLVIGAERAILLGLDDGVQLGADSGCQWSHTELDFSGEAVVDMAGSSTHLLATSLSLLNGAARARVSGSADGGQHFTTLGSVLDDASPVTIEVAPSNAARLYLGMLDGNLENGFIARSDDSGSNWTRLPAPSGPDSEYVSAVDPSDADRVYVRSRSPSALFVSLDAGASWSVAYTSAPELTGFALSPDGQRLALGSAHGVDILDTTGSPATPYPVISNYPTPVNCLTWHNTALYACSTDATGGFAIGVSANGRGNFTPLLRFVDLEPITCPSNPALVQCAKAPCALAELFDAGCATASNPSAADAGPATRVTVSAQRSNGGSCALDRTTGSRAAGGIGAGGLLLGVLALRGRRKASTRRLSTSGR